MAFLQRFRSSFLQITRCYATRYEIPERYRNAFYLANAAFYDQVSWFLHRGYEVCFKKLVSDLRDKNKQLDQKQAEDKVFTVINALEQCNSIIDVRFPVKLEDGTTEVIRGFRAQHGLYSGFNTCLGGLRLKDDITRDLMKGLSVLSTYKHSCMGIRMAGAHGGIKIDPTKYKPVDLEKIVKQYCVEIHSKGYCSGATDIIQPDLNAGGQEMAWIASSFPEDDEKLMVVGKPVEMGGVENYSEAASQGVFFALDHFVQNEKVLEKIGLNEPGLKDKTFMIQGLGDLGSALAKYLNNSGAICVGVKEHDGFLYDSDGIDIEALIKHKDENGTIQDFHNVKPEMSDEIFKQHCDILLLAAQQKSLICYVADHVKAKVVVEAANGSVTQTAHRILVGHSKLVLPDIYVSSGHSVASYLEYLLNLRKLNRDDVPLIRYLYKHILDNFGVSKQTHQLVSSAVIQKMVSCDIRPDILTYGLDHVMAETGNDLLEIAKDYNLGLDLRTAGYIKAIKTIHDSIYELKRY